MSDPTANLVTSDALLLLTVNVAEVRGDDLTSAMERQFTAEVERTRATKVVLDMGAVTYITSTGVRTLLTLYHHVKKASGRVVLCGLNEMVSEVLALMRFIDPAGERPSPFEVKPDVTAAVLALLTPSRPVGQDAVPETKASGATS
jgi:anti-anti-sigma factor